MKLKRYLLLINIVFCTKASLTHTFKPSISQRYNTYFLIFKNFYLLSILLYVISIFMLYYLLRKYYNLIR